MLDSPQARPETPKRALDQDLLQKLRDYAREVHGDEVRLLKELAAIPAPTGHEEKRAQFVARWLRDCGATNVRIDEVHNVICLLEGHPRGEGTEGGAAKPAYAPGQADVPDQSPRPVRVFAAHTDIVFDDTETLPEEVRGRRLYAPGVGDDTANLVALLSACHFLLTHPKAYARATREADLLVVANTCEEGLGNLEGTKTLFGALEEAERQVAAFFSFDLYIPQVISRAVGSERWSITVSCQGGHSYQDFGRPNAIEVLCRIIERLYALPLPVDPADGAHTTRNVGTITGGTTVNAIAARATARFEYRSESSANLAAMQEALRKVIADAQEDLGAEGTVELKVIGIRPGSGDVDQARLKALSERTAALIHTVTGETPDRSPASTDANVPLSLGIPAVTVGAVHGSLLHTRDEWVDLPSLINGLVIVLGLMLEV